MAPYDDWNKLEEEEEDELEDTSFYDARRDVILFAIDASSSMLALYDDPAYEPGEVQTCHLYTALDAAMQIMKKKVIVGPNDSIGIMLFNTTRRNVKGDPATAGQSSEIKRGTFVFQPISTVNAPNIQELMRLLYEAREAPGNLGEEFPPLEDEQRIAMGDVFTSCNWVMRDGAPKTATKRVFLITDCDDPLPPGYSSAAGRERLVISAQTTLMDLTQAGVAVEPFFISSDDRPFDTTKFYSAVLLPSKLLPGDEEDTAGTLPESISITRIDDLLAQMRFHEVPKRSVFSLALELAPGFAIGVKGYGLVTEQKKGSYIYFRDDGDHMEIAKSRTSYVDEEFELEKEKRDIFYGGDLGAAGEEGETRDELVGARTVELGKRALYTADEVKEFRTMGLQPGLKLLGFKDRNELAFEDNVKHSFFIYPSETAYSGSRRTFCALLRSMIKKDKIGLVRALTRRNSSPVFCAMLPQAEKTEEGGWNEPAGFHLIPLPYADDIRAAPVEKAARAGDDLKDLARKWVDKLCVKNGAYPPDSYPNPSLAFHNAQLQAAAFREEYDPATFEDVTLPKIDMIHKRAGPLIAEWKAALGEDASAGEIVVLQAGTKRKAEVGVGEAEVRERWEEGLLKKCTVVQLKAFLSAKGQSTAGKKDDLLERTSAWLEKNP